MFGFAQALPFPTPPPIPFTGGGGGGSFPGFGFGGGGGGIPEIPGQSEYAKKMGKMLAQGQPFGEALGGAVKSGMQEGIVSGKALLALLGFA